MVNTPKFALVAKESQKDILNFMYALDIKMKKHVGRPSSPKANGPARLPKVLVVDLLHALEKAKGNGKSLSLLFDFLRSGGELEIWHEANFSSKKKKLRFVTPNKDLSDSTQWARTLKHELLLTYFSVGQNKMIETLNPEQERESKELLARLSKLSFNEL